ncbi:hypothetical protein RhiirC2_774046 [Rhizophagus irregularis]|uniref:Uncharacterized protein n=1 Tax=Rhizophagus irregularis TaxID=588596 RepID=A0A2N1NML3_9GLOM|nr:hypothetical protein RhiirC2_774046 [Rhizophagus irregularis]
MATPINLYDIQSMRYKRSVTIEKPNSSLLPSSIHSVDPLLEIPANASAQRRAADTIQLAEKKNLQIYNISIDVQIRDDMYQKIESLRNEVKFNKDRIIKLKRSAKYAQNYLHKCIHNCVEFGSADAK